MKLVGSRASDHLYLSGTASRLGIDSGRDDPNFLDQIGTDVRVREGSKIVPAVRHDETISSRIDGAEPRTCKVTLEPVTGGRTGARRRQHEIQNVPARQRQIAHLIVRQHGY